MEKEIEEKGHITINCHSRKEVLEVISKYSKGRKCYICCKVMINLPDEHYISNYNLIPVSVNLLRKRLRDSTVLFRLLDTTKHEGATLKIDIHSSSIFIG